MSLNHLPVEIVLLIIKYLEGKSRALASLAASSKRLLSIAIPVLYSDIKLIPRISNINRPVEHLVRGDALSKFEARLDNCNPVDNRVS
jgi:hypothetical protein